MASYLPKPDEMNFNSSNLEETWNKWIKNMNFYLTATVKAKSDEEKYCAFLFLIGERGREIYSNWTWEKKRNADGEETDEIDISLAKIIQKFEVYCTPKKNIVMERRRFFLRYQGTGENVDIFATELRTLARNCEFGAISDSLIMYKVVDGITSDKVRSTLLRKGNTLTLDKAMEICRSDEVSESGLKLLGNKSGKEVNAVNKQRTALP